MQNPNGGPRRNGLAEPYAATDPLIATQHAADALADGAEGADMDDEQLEQDAGREQEGAKGLVDDLHGTIVHGAATFFKDVLVPQAASIEEELEQLQHDIASVTNEAHHEKELVEQELDRLSNLVSAFQQRIKAFLAY